MLSSRKAPAAPGRLAAAVALGLAFTSAGEPSGTHANRFGFTGPEIFPIDNQITLLRAADLDGDGLMDLVVVNNARSKITLLCNQAGKANRAASRPDRKREINELPPDSRFRIESIASEKRIASMIVEDLNSDGRPDIAYYGEPKEFIVLYNQGSNNWSGPKRWPIEDAQINQNGLCAGDANADGRTDLVLLAESYVYFFAHKEDHTLADPVKIPFSGTLKSVQIVDIDADGRGDLLLVNWEDRHPFRFRLQQSDGELGPEFYFSSPPIRSYWADNLEPKGRTQIMTIAQNSGRAQIAEFVRKPAEGLSGSFAQGQLQVIPLNKTDKARRGVLWADLNGDGLPDLLVAEPENGQLSISLQTKGGNLASPQRFPTLAGISDLAVADWEGDGRPEMFMLSADERQVGVARLDEKQRLPFPALIPLPGRPLAFAVGALQSDFRPVLAIIADDEGRRSLILRTADGTTRTQKLNESFKSNPTVMSFHDADQDGLADLVILIPYEKVKILRQLKGGSFEELDIAPPGGMIEQPWLSAVDVDGDGKPELLLTQKNFVRAAILKHTPGSETSTNRLAWSFTVKEQINGAASNSRLAGAAAIPNGTNASPSLFLLDVERKMLSLCERDFAGVWQVVRNLPLPIAEFNALQPMALGGTNLNAVACLGVNTVACLSLAGSVWGLNELDSYETPIKDGRLNDVITGDLDSDGRKDLVFLETAKNYLDLVIFDASHKLVPATRWQVFEERTFRGRRSDLPEPREAVVADFTGDGKQDLAVLVHDRILLYPQE